MKKQIACAPPRPAFSACNILRQFSDKLKTGALRAASENKFFSNGLKKPTVKALSTGFFYQLEKSKIQNFF
ncbi:MAG: hypothetical protein ONB46_01010 [candidate division KSB1 bacterium]|nr:hypothetical protein [candidate division KSB1 bacterium]MDZ7364579.1 hypothetical protein [candidate division KSB1 bacterium]MDZ7402673.1 hypothetical protein [candidate division KSB1 bacterium]